MRNGQDGLLPAAIIAAVMAPVATLCMLLIIKGEDSPYITVVIMPQYLPYCWILWKIQNSSGRKKLLRLLMMLAGAAGIIAPVALYAAQAYGLGGIWYMVQAACMTAAGCMMKEHGKAETACAFGSALLCIPGCVNGILRAVMHYA